MQCWKRSQSIQVFQAFYQVAKTPSDMINVELYVYAQSSNGSAYWVPWTMCSHHHPCEEMYSYYYCGTTSAINRLLVVACAVLTKPVPLGTKVPDQTLVVGVITWLVPFSGCDYKR